MMHWTSIVYEVSNYISNKWARSVRKNGVTPRSGFPQGRGHDASLMKIVERSMDMGRMTPLYVYRM